jgi:UDP-N-acetylmuramoylalanine--D-glutamate ligase
METVRRFRPAVAVLLNIHPNHLDRHPDMAAYTALKTRIFADLRTRDHGVAPLGLAGAARGAGGTCRLTTFGVEPGADFRYAAGRVRYAAATGEEEISFDGTHFANDILGLTAAAASAAMRACGVDTRCVELAARRFEPLPHRMAEVAVVRGVRFVDDSKATNLAATAAAVRMCGGPVRLIAGGLLKETELRPAIEPLAGTVRAAYLIGDAARKLEGAWREVIPCSVCGDLRSAVREAWKEARGGETVLLAPGCASFDQFRGYDERGERFHDAVQDIAREA